MLCTPTKTPRIHWEIEEAPMEKQMVWNDDDDEVEEIENGLEGRKKKLINNVEEEESFAKEVQQVVQDKDEEAKNVYFDEQQGNEISTQVKDTEDDQSSLLDDLIDVTSIIKHEISNGKVDSLIEKSPILKVLKVENGLSSDYHSEGYNYSTTKSGSEHKEHEIISVENGLSSDYRSERSDGGTTKSVSEVEELEFVTTVKKVHLKVAEYDLEKVLDEQETHDLYCPNCNSCITKRVILRKRKRTVRESQSDAPVKKVHDEQAEIAELGSSSVTHEQTPREDEREPDVFRCLSCFSFFIPTEDGFNIFRLFGKRQETPSERLKQRPERKINWISSIFKSETSKKKGSESGSTVITGTIVGSGTTTGVPPTVIAGTVVASGTTTGVLPHSEGQKYHDIVVPKVNESSSTIGEQVVSQLVTNRESILPDQVRIEEKVTISRDFDTVMGSSSVIGQQVMTNRESILPNRVITEEQETNSKYFDTVIGTSSVIGQQVASQLLITNKESILPHTVISEEQHTNSKFFDKVSADERQPNTQAQYKSDTPIELPSGAIANLPEFTVNDGKHVMGDNIIISEISQTIVSSAGDAATPLLSTHIQIDIGQQNDQVSRQGTGWDVLKAIVYGGLLESITSLGVVSAAAGTNASTLNIVALGLANLIGGLLVIVHDLFDLRTAHDEVTDRNDEHVGRYWQFLGWRKNFRRHFFVAIITYFVAGLLPPAVYGFSWWESDNKEYKVVSVAASSLLCISLLAIGKAHVKHKAYWKYLCYYLSLGFSASGLSYVAGVLINRLLEKLGLFNSDTHSPVPSNLNYPGIGGNFPMWAS